MTAKAPSIWWGVFVWTIVLSTSAVAAERLSISEQPLVVALHGGLTTTVEISASGSSHLTVDQVGIDVELTLLDAAGEVLFRSNAAGERNAQEILPLPAGASRIRLESVNPSASPGSAHLRVVQGSLHGPSALLAVGHRYFAQGRSKPMPVHSCGRRATSGLAAAAQCYALAAELDPDRDAYARFLQADAERASSNYASAIELYRSAEARSVAQGLDETLGAVYAGWGWSLSRQGRYDQAREVLNRALEVIKALVRSNDSHPGFRYDLGSVKNNLCLQDLRQDRLDSAERCLSDLESFTRASDDSNLRLLILNGLGGFHRMVGQPGAAIARFEEALKLAEANGDLRREALLHNNLGWTYRASSEYAKGIQHAIAATRISSQLAWTDQTTLAQANLGRLYALVGDYDRARHWYGIAIEGSKQDRRLASRYLALGDVELAQGRASEALLAYQAGANIADRLETPRLQLAAADRLIRVHLILRNYAEIAAVSAAAEDHASRAQDRLSLASYDLAIGEYQLAIEESEGALSRFQKALPEYEKLGFSTGIANAQFGIARYWYARDDLVQAEHHIDQAIRNLEATRANLWTLFERINFNRVGQEIYAFAIDLQMQHFFDSGTSQRAMAGLVLAERRKAQTLTELNARPDLRDTQTEAAADAATSIRRRVAMLQSQLLQSSDQPDSNALSSPLRSRLRADYFSALDELQSLELSAAAETMRNRFDLTADDINQLSDSARTVVSVFVGEQSSYAWRLEDGRLTAYQLPPRAVVESEVVRLLQALRLPGDQPARSVYGGAAFLELRRVLEMPEKGTGHRLLISADGPLHLLPFAALKDSEGRYLVERFEITMSPGLGVAARAYTQSARPSKEAALVLADPVFSRTDRRLGEHRSSQQLGHLRLPRLPGTRAELQVLADLVEASQLSVLTDFEATRENLMAQELSGFKLLHFGTHGLLDPRTPDGFGLALTSVSNKGAPLDWLLNIHDIARLDLTASLVVLSGCDTAQGEQIDGAGVVGLTRAFLYAGSRRVMSSLWQVSDRSTAKLMRHFYQAYLAQQQSAAGALRAAQLSMLDQAERAHPYHWAAFAISAGTNAIGEPALSDR